MTEASKENLDPDPFPIEEIGKERLSQILRQGSNIEDLVINLLEEPLEFFEKLLADDLDCFWDMKIRIRDICGLVISIDPEYVRHLGDEGISLFCRWFDINKALGSIANAVSDAYQMRISVMENKMSASEKKWRICARKIRTSVIDKIKSIFSLIS